MQDALITYKQLKEVVGGSSFADVTARLESQNIPYKLGKRGSPFTTFSALNFAMGLPLNIDRNIKKTEEDIIEI